MSPQLRLICAHGRHHAYVFTGTQGVSALATDPKGAPGTPVAPCKKKEVLHLYRQMVHAHTHTPTRTCKRTRTRTRAQAHAHTHTHTRTHAHTHAHTHPHTHTPTRPHTHTPTRTPTCTQTCSRALYAYYREMHDASFQNVPEIWAQRARKGLLSRAPPDQIQTYQPY